MDHAPGQRNFHAESVRRWTSSRTRPAAQDDRRCRADGVHARLVAWPLALEHVVVEPHRDPLLDRPGEAPAPHARTGCPTAAECRRYRSGRSADRLARADRRAARQSGTRSCSTVRSRQPSSWCFLSYLSTLRAEIMSATSSTEPSPRPSSPPSRQAPPPSLPPQPVHPIRHGQGAARCMNLRGSGSLNLRRIIQHSQCLRRCGGIPVRSAFRPCYLASSELADHLRDA